MSPANSSHLAAATAAPLNALVIASEQLTPNLQFLLHVARQFPLRPLAVHIYCSDDETRSAAPARRLRECLHQTWRDQPAPPASIEIVQGGKAPQDVRPKVQGILQQDPDGEWLINVTGGNKLMSAAVAEVALWSDLSRCRVVYCEIDGGWFEIDTDDDGLLAARYLAPGDDPIVPHKRALDSLIRVESLVAAQFSEDHVIAAQAGQRMPLLAWTEELVRNRWHWLAGLRAVAPASPSSSNGDAFERFIAAGLLAAGLSPVHSLKVSNARSDKVVREVDLVGCANGRLYCVDIKLPGATEDAKGTQMADVAALALALGGRGAQAVAIRPGWAIDRDTEVLAQALNVRLLSIAEAPRLFSTLLGWLDPDQSAPDELFAVEQLLQREAALGRVVLSDGTLVQSARPTQAGVLTLTNELQRMAWLGGRMWAVANLGQSVGYQLIVFRQSPGFPRTLDWPVFVDRVILRLQRIATLKLEPELSKLYVVIVFSMRSGHKQTEALSLLDEAIPWRASDPG